VNRSNSPTWSGWAIILLCATASQPTAAPQAAAPAADTEAQQAATPSVFNPTYGSDAQPTAPKGRKKAFVLDPLLD
jgi:hypothetical protein